MTQSAILIYSGGLDSTVLLYHLRAQRVDVRALSINYGQRHLREIGAARRITARIAVEHQVADAQNRLLGECGQMLVEVVHGATGIDCRD